MQLQKTSEVRSAARKNMFLVATLCAGEGRSPVKIRNMSRSGAMIEAAVLPSPGAAVRLVRGGLEATGRIAWRSDRHCGVEFAGAVSVEDWLAPVGHSAQQRVDAAVARFKADPAGPAARPHMPALAAVPTITDSLRTLCGLLDKLGTDLAADPAIVARHSRELQSFDIATQLLEAIRLQLADHADDGAAARRLTDLRAACAQATAVG